MKKTIAFMALIMFSLSSFADELSLELKGADAETEVVVKELKDPPVFTPKKAGEKPPRWWKLTLFGLGLAPIEFFISTALHEGAHAVSAEANGADVTGFHPWPHKHEGRPFRFGDTHWQGTLTPGEKALTLAAPMFLDTAVLGAYGSLVLSDSLPENRYAKLSMFVFAAGHFVDLATHLVGRNEFTDTQRVEKYFQTNHGLSVMESRLAVRGSQALVLAAGGFFLYKGFRQIFKDTAREDEAGRPLDMSAVEAYDKKMAEKRRKEKNKKFSSRHDLYLSPSVSGEGGGFVFGGSF